MQARYRFNTNPVAEQRAVVQGTHYRFTVLADGLIRLEWSEDGAFEDRASTFAIHRHLPVPEFRVVDGEDMLEIITQRLHLKYDRRAFSRAGLSIEVRGGVTNYHSVWRYGEAFETFGGTARTLDLADGRIPLEPGIVGKYGFSMIDDSGSFCFTEDGWIDARVLGRLDLYIFTYGRDHAAALEAFYSVSGSQPLLPRWALGNWWSRYHKYSQDEYLALMDRFRNERIPIAVSVIDMDWHLVEDVDPKYGSGWTGYTWDRKLFPNPEATLAALHDRGKRITLNVHPADGVRAFEDAYQAMCAALGLDGNGADAIDFDPTDRAFMDAYFDVLHRGLERQGVDFWWVDWQQGTSSRVAGIDPLWILNHFHYLDNAQDGGRPLTFSRYAGPGSHRYPVGFSGDSVITWESLAFQPEFTAKAANIGYGWWSHDIGGHMWGYKNDELTTRWVQLGVFSPILRLHSTSDPFMTKEPWAFALDARNAMTSAMQLRHRLVPYLHSMNHRAASGAPLVQPLYYTWQDEPEAYQHDNEYTFGSELLVAPITEALNTATRLASVTAWLPPGTWIDIFTGLVYDGNREMALHRGLTSIPVFARAGSIIPLDAADVPGDDPTNPSALEVLIAVGASGTFTLIEDDGAADASIARTVIGFDQATGTLTVQPAQGASDVVPNLRDWTFTFLTASAHEWIGTRVGAFDHHADVIREPGRIKVSVKAASVHQAIEVRIGSNPQLPVNDVRGRLYELLDAAQMDYRLKSRVLAVAGSSEPLHVRVAHTKALALESALESAVLELLLAR